MSLKILVKVFSAEFFLPKILLYPRGKHSYEASDNFGHNPKTRILVAGNLDFYLYK